LPELPPPPDAHREAWEALARPHRTPVIWAEGNPRAPIAIVLDNPGAREREGVAWVCPTRDTLRAAAREASLSDLYVTWLVKFRPRHAYDKAAVRALGRDEVLRELARVNPRVVVALGDVVAAALFDDPDAHVRELRGRERSIGRWPCVVSYHPLAAWRRPNLYPLVVDDLRRARDALAAGESTVERRSR
jgi:uracil-DNA glycosylase